MGFGISAPRAAAASAPVTLTLAIDTSRPAQQFLGFGSSACWWAQEIGGWPEAERREIARLLYDKKTGLGLDIYRHNLGADTHAETAFTNPTRRTESMLDTATGRYDWTRDAKARLFMRDAVAAGASEIILFANSPPVSMTINHRGYGGRIDGKNVTNLDPSRYAAFAAYLAEVTNFFLNVEKLPVTAVSPLNEPEWDWTTKHLQEGCHNTPAQTAAILRAVHDEFQRRALPVRVEGPEGGSWESTIPYFEAINNDPVLRAGMKNFAVHSYWSNNAQREKFRAWLDANRPDARLHMTEWCEMKRGNAPGMDSALVLAQTIIEDLTLTRAATWQYWVGGNDIANSFHAGLFHYDRDTREVTLPKRYWAMAQFSRYLVKGSTLLALESSDKNAPALAARLPDGRLAVICANLSKDPKTLHIKFPANATETWRQQQRIITDARHDATETPAPAAATLPPQSVMTMIFQKGY